jgi:hypothetical protein
LLVLTALTASGVQGQRDGWWPCFSPQAKYLVTGNAWIWTSNGDASAAYNTTIRGLHPKFVDSSTIVFIGWYEKWKKYMMPYILKYPFTGQPTPAPVAGAPPVNWLVGGNGLFAAFSAWGDNPVTVSDGRRFPHRFLGWMSQNGVLVMGGGPAVNYSATNIYRVAPGSTQEELIDSWPLKVLDPYVSEDGSRMVWSRYVPGGKRTFGLIYGTGEKPQDLTVITPIEHNPIIVTVPGNNTWIMSYDAARFVIRQWGSTQVILLGTGKCLNPHAAWDPATKLLRVAWSDTKGKFFLKSLNLLQMPSVPASSLL